MAHPKHGIANGRNLGLPSLDARLLGDDHHRLFLRQHPHNGRGDLCAVDTARNQQIRTAIDFRIRRLHA